MTVYSLLTPNNCTVIFIDHQPQMLFGVTSIDRQTLINNTVGLAKAAKIFGVPVILTTAQTKSFSGYMWSQLLDLFPGKEPIERTSMNPWEDKHFTTKVEQIGRQKLVMAALWTEVGLVFPAIQALEVGYEVYAVVDASGGTSVVAHDMALQRTIQAGAIPVTWLQVLLEFQRDWAKRETYNPVMEVIYLTLPMVTFPKKYELGRHRTGICFRDKETLYQLSY